MGEIKKVVKEGSSEIIDHMNSIYGIPPAVVKVRGIVRGQRWYQWKPKFWSKKKEIDEEAQTMIRPLSSTASSHSYPPLQPSLSPTASTSAQSSRVSPTSTTALFLASMRAQGRAGLKLMIAREAVWKNREAGMQGEIDELQDHIRQNLPR